MRGQYHNPSIMISMLNFRNAESVIKLVEPNDTKSGARGLGNKVPTPQNLKL